LLAFALALKTLSAPQGRWRYKEADLRSACLFAGLENRPAGQELSRLSARVQHALELGNVAAAECLIDGHNGQSPYVLLSSGADFVLMEPEGQFPVMTVPGIKQLCARLAPAGSLLFVSRDAASPAALSALDHEGIIWMAEGDVQRGEIWLPLAGPRGWRGVTNSGDCGISRFSRRGPRFSAAAATSCEVWQALNDLRPVLAGAQKSGLENSLSIAAGLGLGTLSWRLFEKNPDAWRLPDPLLAMARFATLSGRLTVARDHVTVKLPLGPRLNDLRAAGLVCTVHHIPWWQGRSVRFEGG
jgi:hypothetical protein